MERERERERGGEREGAEQRGIELVTLETWQLADKQRQGKWVGQVDRRTNGRTTSRLGVGGYQLWTGDFGTKNESQKRENDLNRASPHFSSSLICSVHTTHTHTRATRTYAHTHIRTRTRLLSLFLFLSPTASRPADSFHPSNRTLAQLRFPTLILSLSLSLLKRHQDKHDTLVGMCVCVRV